MASSTEAGADAEGGVTADADAAGRACAALLHATPPARQFAPLYLCRILVRSEAFATAFLDGEAFQGGRGYMTLPLTLTPTLTPALTLSPALTLTLSLTLSLTLTPPSRGCTTRRARRSSAPSTARRRAWVRVRVRR